MASVQGTLPPDHVLRERYQIQGVLGVGSTCAVYQARDLLFAIETRLCAVKEMINLASDPVLLEYTFQNFQREGNVLASLNHQAIPEVYDFFVEGNRAYLVLEYIKGRDLRALVNDSEGFLPVEDVRTWAMQICEVLHYLHQHQPHPVIHRDVKPSSVMIDQFRRVRLVGFNTARAVALDETVTRTGTRGYKAPEQYRGKPLPQSDLYGLGATLHHVLTRRDPHSEPPFSWEKRPIQEYNPDVPDGFVAVVNRALEYEPLDRYATAAEMWQALQALG